MVKAFNPALGRQKQMHLYAFKARLVHRVATQRNPVLKTDGDRNRQTKTERRISVVSKRAKNIVVLPDYQLWPSLIQQENKENDIVLPQCSIPHA